MSLCFTKIVIFFYHPHSCSGGTGATKTININAYKRLLVNSIEWQKAKRTIAKLKDSLCDKMAVIRNLQKKVRLYEKHGEKSSVNFSAIKEKRKKEK